MAIQLTAWKYINRAGDAEKVEALACAEGLKLALDSGGTSHRLKFITLAAEVYRR